MSQRLSRRALLRTTGAVVLAGTVAGCSGGDSPSGDGGDQSTATDTPTNTPTATATETSTESGGTSIEEFLSNTGNFDGIQDETGSSSVDVEVGTQGNVAYYAFSPAAIRIDQGTTVTWTWTGQGSQHNVVAVEGGDFESELKSEAGATFEHTFEEPGTVLYVCVPHEGTGMKGAVVVE
ncbi:MULTISPECIES: halocyanin domain-containing protein [Salinibaculum]|uniref:halocyanin domain-containing protein n=1 Tax=Salinibaculum TaxID=2732368 RepID=UPI0030CF12DA